MGGYAPKGVRQAATSRRPVVLEDGCDLRFNVDLVGVRPDQVRGLVIGDALLVQISENGKWRSLVCVTNGGGIVGTLAAFQGLAQLIACVEAGARYIAVVEFASATRCSVEVIRA
ncbi:hypothetical protein ASC75_19175 [Aminobacter sp. DSM 101952]|uniref:hypothetical protein n=1 Tax=Aminobacter sp. DSM 101952 TaxID=2735891 RepID=UPI0006F6D76B|nr:hypothetical protein [Aminobacter sp. DSM 101952]KQU75457.1 hypothetical protein ASC75_19175 [Aminobacter sp. DSM 101952]